MTWDDIVRKLTSRKFWMAVASFAASVMALFNVCDDTATKITALIMAFATVIAYIIGEGLVDANRTIINDETFFIEGSELVEA